MPVIHLLNLSSSELGVFRDLRHVDRAVQQGLFVVEGQLLVERLIASRFPLHSILVMERWLPRLPAGIGEATPIYVIPNGMIHELVGFHFHRGILAAARRLPQIDWSAYLLHREKPLVILCPELNDPENVGQILRVSAAFGVDLMLLGQACPDSFSRRIMRVSMGAALTVPTVRVSEFRKALQILKKRHHCDVIAAVSDPAAQPIGELVASGPLALLLGREDCGIPSEFVQECTHYVTVPMRPGVDSLNVAMAATIFLYHLASAEGRSKAPD